MYTLYVATILFDVGIIYLLDVNKCTHLVSGEMHSTFLEYGALLSRLLEISAIKISYYYNVNPQGIK